MFKYIIAVLLIAAPAVAEDVVPSPFCAPQPHRPFVEYNLEGMEDQLPICTPWVNFDNTKPLQTEDRLTCTAFDSNGNVLASATDLVAGQFNVITILNAQYEQENGKFVLNGQIRCLNQARDGRPATQYSTDGGSVWKIVKGDVPPAPPVLLPGSPMLLTETP